MFFTNHGHRVWQQRCVQGIFLCPAPHLGMGSGTAGWATEVCMQDGVSVVCKRRDSARNHKKEGVTCSAMHNNQCTTVNAVWCTERRVGVHKCLCIAYGTGKADVIGEPHNSKAHSLSRKAFLYETNVFCTK